MPKGFGNVNANLRGDSPLNAEVKDSIDELVAGMGVVPFLGGENEEPQPLFADFLFSILLHELPIDVPDIAIEFGLVHSICFN